jgi:hypothetical protein
MKPAVRRIFQFAFGCHHRRMSRVFTIKKRTYQLCFECGQEFEYSWTLMHPLPSNVAHQAIASLNHSGRSEVSVI